ncbi:expressed unknown protein [Seminavis robusta]|uniref:Uncharacterized protein n=1 Tax=Seminavis robusta TaxID=568900 RepID=A0A9N8E4N5_9STRA|nr:expressed unknown protein [Seminavis robusta]|eukprot:Sro663_g183520.1 n/a (298) ;mRNA; r:29827-30720
MSYALSLYFAALLEEKKISDNGQRLKGDGDSSSPIEVIFDNARLPAPVWEPNHSFGAMMMSSISEMHDSSCHTRSTISTCTSTLSSGSNNSCLSAGSTGSNSSAGSCRWDSNPSSSKEKNTNDGSLKRPKRPGRKTSDNTKHRGEDTTMKDIRVEPPPRSKKYDKPQRPKRTSSNGSASSSSSRTEKRTNHKNRRCKELDQNAQSPATSSSLDKMLLHSKKLSVTNNAQSSGGTRESDSSSENSLKEIFRSASHQRRHGSGDSGPVMAKPLPAARTSPTRTVNEILGQSMEELQISW